MIIVNNMYNFYYISVKSKKGKKNSNTNLVKNNEEVINNVQFSTIKSIACVTNSVIITVSKTIFSCYINFKILYMG